MQCATVAGRVGAIDESVEPEWNQTVAWSNIKRVCWKDGGMMSSDIIYVTQIEPDCVVVVPTEARGGSEFFGQLCERSQLVRGPVRKTGAARPFNGIVRQLPCISP